MFPLQSDGLLLKDLSIFEQDKFLEDLLADCAALDGNERTDKGVEKRQRKASSAGGIDQENKDDEAKGNNESKKLMHRNIERQRRKEMSDLYSSLRSLLPPEYTKGKRSISDHMHQAANYIKHMEKKIEKMQIRRDKLKKLSHNAPRTADKSPNKSNSASSVKVNPCKDGMEILVSSSRKVFPLSKVLADLLGRGLNVISCISTRSHEWSLHKIQIEVNEHSRSIDPSELEERLVNVIRLA